MIQNSLSVFVFLVTLVVKLNEGNFLFVAKPGIHQPQTRVYTPAF